MARPRVSIGREELLLLRYVADHQPVTVREVADAFAESSGKARTTILTVMERLREKRYLTRRKVRGVYHYAPRIEKGEFLREQVSEFVRETLGGSLSPFMAYLSRGAELSGAELEQLRRIVDDLEEQRKGDPR